LKFECYNCSIIKYPPLLFITSELIFFNSMQLYSTSETD